MTAGSRQSGNGELWPEPPTNGEGMIIAYCDGGSRGNPGPAGYGVHIEDAEGKTLAQLGEYVGRKTNNFAEYSGLLAALNFARQQGYSRLKVISDSELMVKQIKGQYRVQSAELRPLYEEAKRRISRLDRFEIQHVLREKNRDADLLANEAMDRGMGRTAPASGPPVPARDLRGFVKGGVVHFLEGELPDGIFVRITPERR